MNEAKTEETENVSRETTETEIETETGEQENENTIDFFGGVLSAF